MIIRGKVPNQNPDVRMKITEVLIEFIKCNSKETAEDFIRKNELYLTDPWCIFVIAKMMEQSKNDPDLFNKLMMRYEILDSHRKTMKN
jgi:hypothetical protein